MFANSCVSGLIDHIGVLFVYSSNIPLLATTNRVCGSTNKAVNLGKGRNLMRFVVRCLCVKGIRFGFNLMG